MLDRLRALRWLAPPDLGERRTALAAATARAVGWLTIAFGLAWLTACALFLGLPPTRLAACLGAVAVGAGVVALAGRRQVRVAGLLAAVGTFALVTLGTTRAEHVLAPQNLSFFAVVTVAGLTLGGRAGVAAALACILVLMARWGGSQAQPAPPIDPIVAIAVQGTLLLVVALLLQIARVRNDAALSAAERHERAAERRNRELDRERERFRVMSESSQNLITELDLAGNVRYASPNHAEILGWTPEELVGQDWQKVIHSEAVILADHALGLQPRAGEVPPTTYRVRHRDGSILWLESLGRAFTAADGETRLLAVTRDVTERVALETQLRQSQKLEAVGRLAGGVAHDFNNLLTVINLYSEILLEEERFRNVPELREIQGAGQRAQALTRQLLTFSRRQPLSPRVLDLDAALRGVESLLLRLLGEHIALSFQPSLEPLSVLLDPVELEQVIVNLAVNARDAMPEGGRIQISTRSETRPLGPAGDAKESWAVLEVRDEGEGMGPPVLARLFEPFFTTKEVGEGTGLGLSVVHGIVEQSGGHIEVDSEPGIGSCFRIYLRRVEGVGHELPTAPPEPVGTAGPATILLAEDDPAVRRLVRGVLHDGGYRVIEAATGVEALATLQRGGERVDLLLTDVVMPGMGGQALSERLAELRPGTPTVFMSGYPDRELGGTPLDARPGDRVIGKPFTRRALLETVRGALAPGTDVAR